MNFFERQQQVRRLSWRLVGLFALAVVGIVAVIDVAVLVAVGDNIADTGALVTLIAGVSLVTGTVIGLASLARTVGLRRGGGGDVARGLGGIRVPEDTTDPQLRRLRNVVEEISLASGVPAPDVYVLPREAGINAFAAGWSPADAAVAVTRGALDRLNRAELQGVIAHEFSHVVNGDMRLNIRLMGLLYGILVLGIVGRAVLQVSGGGRGGRRDSRGGNPVLIVGLAVFAAGYTGVLVGRLIKASIARQREFLADASAVQFTRQTAGLAGALMKIAGLPESSTVADAKAEEIGHMLFGAASGRRSLFDTHPPLLERIRALDPSFDPAVLEESRRTWATAPPSGLEEDRALGLAPAGDAMPAADAAVSVRPDAVVAHVGAPTSVAYDRAGTILDQIPEELLARARQPDTALALVFGLLLSANPSVRANQLHAVARRSQAVADAAARDAEAVAALHPGLRLPLAECAFPALRRRSRAGQDAVMQTVQELIRADGRLSLSEYCLSRLLHRELYEAMHHHPPATARRAASAARRDAASALLGMLAHAGHDDPEAAARAFHAGMAKLLPDTRVAHAAPTAGLAGITAEGAAALDAAWPVLDGLKPRDKAQLVESMVTVIMHDGSMTVAEIELLRTVCAILHCPLPPMAEATLPA